MSSWHVPHDSEPAYPGGGVAELGGPDELACPAALAAAITTNATSNAKSRPRRLPALPPRLILRMHFAHREAAGGAVANCATLSERAGVDQRMRCRSGLHMAPGAGRS